MHFNFSFLFLKKNIQCEKKYRLITLIIQNILILSFYIFTFKFQSFLNYSTSSLRGIRTKSNITDPALAIHPPILCWFSKLLNLFFNCLSSLITNFHEKILQINFQLGYCFVVSNFRHNSWPIWAYYELGWGGSGFGIRLKMLHFFHGLL